MFNNRKIDIKTIKSVYGSISDSNTNSENENREAKMRKIEDKLNQYNMLILRIEDGENKTIMTQKLNELKIKLNHMRNTESLKQQKIIFKKLNPL